MAHHNAMTYVFRSYCFENEPAQHVIYFCNKYGERMVQSYESLTKAKALVNVLDYLGFTRKRR